MKTHSQDSGNRKLKTQLENILNDDARIVFDKWIKK